MSHGEDTETPAGHSPSSGNVTHAPSKQDRVAKVAGLRKTTARKLDPKKLLQVVCVRLRKSREMSGMSQTEAAEFFGFKNSSGLCKIESGESAPTMAHVAKAAMLYGVTADYLMGLSNDPDRDEGTVCVMALGRSLRTALTHTLEKAAAEVLAQSAKAPPIFAKAIRMAEDASGIWAAALEAKKTGAWEQFMETLGDYVEQADAVLRATRIGPCRGNFGLDGIEYQYPLLEIMENPGRSGSVEAMRQIEAF